MRLFKVDSEAGTVREVEGEPYPGSDEDGDRVYENTHFSDERAAWDRLKREMESLVKNAAEWTKSAQWELRTARNRSAKVTLRMAKYIENRDAWFRSKED